MDTALLTELQDRLLAYVRGQITLRMFEEWFVPVTWDVHDEDDARLVALRNLIDARIAGYTSGDWTEEELRDFLRPIAETRVIPLASGATNEVSTRTASQSSVRRMKLTLDPTPGALPLVSPNPEILATRPDTLDDEAERNAHEPLAFQV
jgi:hypothetical protein